MERNEILKSIGFSDSFLKALNEFDNSFSDVYYNMPFDENKHDYKVEDTSDRLIVNRVNDIAIAYDQNYIISNK